MKVYVVYSSFPDDPSTIHGIYTNREIAFEHLKKLDEQYKDIEEFETDSECEVTLR